MNWKVLKTEENYNIATARLMEIFDALPGTSAGDEMELLMVLVKDYDDKHYAIPAPDPQAAIKIKMEEQGIIAKDLELIPGSKGHVSSVLSGRREITLKTARVFRDLFSCRLKYFYRYSEPFIKTIEFL